MKAFIAFALALLVAGSAAFAPASAHAAPHAAPLDQAATGCYICDFDMTTYDGPLTEAEVVGLLRALNEEYLAWSTYDQAVRDLGALRPFTNIRRSELTHINALKNLFRRYDVPIPANPWPGTLPHFATFTEAVQAGVSIETADGVLYTELATTTNRTDVLRVYRNLRSASLNNHLPAFQRYLP
jgi:hypothetical protein